MQEIRGFSDFPLFPFFPVHFEGMGRGICPPVPFLCETGIKKEQNGYAGCACFMPVKGHGGRNMHAPPMWPDESRTPPLTFRRACAEIFLTDGTGTQGQAGYAHAVLRGIVPQPRQKPKGRPGHSPGGWFTASGCESKDRQGDTASVTFSLIYGAYGRLYGGTVAARRPGCV